MACTLETEAEKLLKVATVWAASALDHTCAEASTALCWAAFAEETAENRDVLRAVLATDAATVSCEELACSAADNEVIEEVVLTAKAAVEAMFTTMAAESDEASALVLLLVDWMMLACSMDVAAEKLLKVDTVCAERALAQDCEAATTADDDVMAKEATALC